MVIMLARCNLVHQILATENARSTNERFAMTVRSMPER